VFDASLLYQGWVKIDGPESAHVKAKIQTLENAASQCIGTAIVRNDCWSFLKGGFILNSPSQTSVLYFQVSSDVEHYTSGKKYLRSDQNSAILFSCVLLLTATDCKPKCFDNLNQKRLLAALLT